MVPEQEVQGQEEDDRSEAADAREGKDLYDVSSDEREARVDKIRRISFGKFTSAKEKRDTMRFSACLEDMRVCDGNEMI